MNAAVSAEEAILELKDFIRVLVIKSGVIWHLNVIKARPAALEHSREFYVQLLHLRSFYHPVEYGLPLSIRVVQGSFLGNLFKPLDPVVGVILLSLAFLCRGLA